MFNQTMGYQHDGKPLLVVVYHSGGDDRGAVHRSELLPLVWHDPHRGRGGIRPFPSLHDRYHRSFCRNLDDTSHTHYDAYGTGLQWVGQITHFVGLFGLMTAKNTVVNLIILTTFLSFLFYRRSGKTPTVSWRKVGNIIIAAIFGLAVAGIVIIGIAGFTVPSDYRVNVLTPVQVMIALAVIDPGNSD